MKTQPIKLGFLATRNGTSMRAILDAIGRGELRADPCLAVSNVRDAPALDYAAAAGVPTVVIPTKSDPEAADIALTTAMEQAQADQIGRAHV